MVVFEDVFDLKQKLTRVNSLLIAYSYSITYLLCVPDLVCTEQEQPPRCLLKEGIFTAVNVMLQLFVIKKWIVSVTNRIVQVCVNTIPGTFMGFWCASCWKLQVLKCPCDHLKTNKTPKAPRTKFSGVLLEPKVFVPSQCLSRLSSSVWLWVLRKTFNWQLRTKSN